MTAEKPQAGGSEWLAGELRKKATAGDLRAGVFADLVAGIPAALGYDIPLPESVLVNTPKSREERVHDVFTEYRKKRWDLTTVQKTWNSLWSSGLWGEATVLPCDRTQEDLAKLEADRRILIYVPESVSKNRNGLFKNALDLRTERSNWEPWHAPNTEEQYGWMDIEYPVLTHELPNVDLTTAQAEKLFASQERSGITLETYIVYISFMRGLGQGYVAEWPSRLLLTQLQGKPVYAHIDYMRTLSVQDESKVRTSSSGSWDTVKHDRFVATPSAGKKLEKADALVA